MKEELSFLIFLTSCISLFFFTWIMGEYVINRIKKKESIDFHGLVILAFIWIPLPIMVLVYVINF